MNVLDARDNLRSKNLHLLDDSLIDYKYAWEFLKVWHVLSSLNSIKF